MNDTGVLRFIADRVQSLKPGQALCVSRGELANIGSARLVGMFGPLWSPVDRIMENVIGSAWEIRATESPSTGDVTFYRLREPSETPLYVSPDRKWT